jgi:hypothetical protein
MKKPGADALCGEMTFRAASRDTPRDSEVIAGLRLRSMIFVVMEEVYSIGPDGSEQLVRRSQQPLFAGDRRTAHTFAKSRAVEFDAADYHADDGNPYFSGRDVAKGEAQHFIIQPAMPA